MKLIIASSNAHKLVEIREILGGHFEEIVSLREAGIDHETVEDGQSFLENARKKAREITELTGCCALADDSGICVDALDGAPGIFSARFCGRHGDDEANNRLPARKARGRDAPRRALHLRHRAHAPGRHLCGSGGAVLRRGNARPRGGKRLRVRPAVLPPAVRLHRGAADPGREKTPSATAPLPCGGFWRSWKSEW